MRFVYVIVRSNRSGPATMSPESVLTMAKKKTAGPDNPPTTPATTRRRSARKIDVSGNEAAPAAAVDGASAESIGSTSASSTIDAANEMASGAGSSIDNESPTYLPSYEEIAEAAYHRYLSRGGRDGLDFEDWLEAERELRSRR